MSGTRARTGGRVRRDAVDVDVASPADAAGAARPPARAPDAALPADAAPASEAARLAREREHLLRSLDDIERERAEGDLDDDAYRMLRDDYTARIAALTRDLRGGPAPRRSRRVRALTTGALVLVFAVALSFALARALGTRTEAGQITGTDLTAARVEQLAAAVEAAPDDATLRAEYAQALMTGDRFEALKQFDAAAALDPANAEVRAYGAWMLYLLAQELTGPDQAVALEGAATRAADAVAVDPEYPDAHFFSGLIRLRRGGDPATAVAEFDRYLELAPDSPMAEQVRAARDEAVAGGR